MSSSTSASSTCAFGSPLFFGQTSNSNASPTNPFGSTSAGGNSMGLFASSSSSPSVWGSSSASMTSSTNDFGSGFGQSISPNGSFAGSCASQYTSGQGSNLFGSASTSFGSNIFGQSSNHFGSASNNIGGTSTGVCRQTAINSPFGQTRNIFGSVPNNGGTFTGLFGTNASTPSFGSQHTLGSVPASAGTPLVICVVTVSPFSSASIATSSSPVLWGSSTGSTTFFQVPAAIVPSSSGFTSGCMTSSGQITVQSSSGPNPNAFSTGLNPFSSGNLGGAPYFGHSDQSSFGENRGSRVTSYSTTATLGEKGEHNMLVSISAMHSYQNKSHEELRWEDHHQFNAGGGGVVPASVQSNDFRNHIARTDGIFPSHIPPVPSNPFSTMVTPLIARTDSTFPSHIPRSVPSNPFSTTVTPLIGGTDSTFPSHIRPSVPSNPFSTMVTPSIVGTHSTFPATPLIARTDSTFTATPTIATPTIARTDSTLPVATPSIARTDGTFPSHIRPSVPFNPFSTTVTPLIGQHSLLNPAPPSASPNPFATAVTPPSTDKSTSKESKNEQKLQFEGMLKSVELTCKDMIHHQEDMKRWTERYRSLELEKMEDTHTINQLREELAKVTKSKDMPL